MGTERGLPPPPPHTHTRAVFPLSGLRLDWMDRVGSRQPSSFSSFFVSSEHSTYVPNYNIAAQPQPVERVIHLCRQAEVHTPDIRKACHADRLSPVPPYMVSGGDGSAEVLTKLRCGVSVAVLNNLEH